MHDTATDGDAPFDANALAKAARRDAVQASRERRSSGRARDFEEFFFDRDRRHLRRAPRPARRHGGYGGDLNLDPAGRRPTPAALAFYLGDQAHTGLDNIVVPRRGPRGRRRGRRRSAAHLAQRAGHRLPVRRRQPTTRPAVRPSASSPRAVSVGEASTGSAGPASTYGGTAGQPYDACYHQACDTVNNLSTRRSASSATASSTPHGRSPSPSPGCSRIRACAPRRRARPRPAARSTSASGEHR